MGKTTWMAGINFQKDRYLKQLRQIGSPKGAQLLLCQLVANCIASECASFTKNELRCMADASRPTADGYIRDLVKVGALRQRTQCFDVSAAEPYAKLFYKNRKETYQTENAVKPRREAESVEFEPKTEAAAVPYLKKDLSKRLKGFACEPEKPAPKTTPPGGQLSETDIAVDSDLAATINRARARSVEMHASLAQQKPTSDSPLAKKIPKNGLGDLAVTHQTVPIRAGSQPAKKIPLEFLQQHAERLPGWRAGALECNAINRLRVTPHQLVAAIDSASNAVAKGIVKTRPGSYLFGILRKMQQGEAVWEQQKSRKRQSNAGTIQHALRCSA